MSHIWTILINVIGLDSASGSGATQYFVWKWRGSSTIKFDVVNCPMTFEVNEIIMVHNVARIVFILLRILFILFIY